MTRPRCPFGETLGDPHTPLSPKRRLERHSVVMVKPAWTIGPARMSEVFWHPGPPALFPNALVHAPGELAVRGVFIEADSLVSG